MRRPLRAIADEVFVSTEASIEIRDNTAERRYEALVEGALAGWIDYSPRDGWIVFVHTEVLPAFGGRGIGARLASHALDDVRSRGLGVNPVCPFVAAYIRSHPAYQDLVVGARGTPVPRHGQDPRDPEARRELS
jgi:predicted GNAT family acetyltransferase